MLTHRVIFTIPISTRKAGFFSAPGCMTNPAISQPGDRPGLLRSGSRPLGVRWADDFRTSMSGNRPEVVQWADDFRTVSGHWSVVTDSCKLWLWSFIRHALCVCKTCNIHNSFDSRRLHFNVRKPSGSRPPTGRLPDGFRTLRSGSRPPTGRQVDDFRTWGGPGDLRVGRSGISSWPWARRRQHGRPPTEHAVRVKHLYT